MREYWFWDVAEAGVTAESLQQRGVVLGDTFDGDELCFDPQDPETLFVLPRDEDVAHRVGPGLIAGLDWLLSGRLNPWVEGWTFEAWTNRADVRREASPGRSLAAATEAVRALGEHSHLVELGDQTTFFLPAIAGRLSLCQLEGPVVRVALSHDDTADPAAVARILSQIAQA